MLHFSLMISLFTVVTFIIRRPESSLASIHFLNLILRSIPTVLIIPYLLNKPVDWHIQRIYLLNIFFGLSFIRFLPKILDSNFVYLLLNFGGVNYNDLSYISALNIVFSILILKFKDPKYNNKKKLTLPILLLSIVILLISAGRGAIISIFIIGLYSILLKVNKIKLSPKSILKILVILLFLIPLFSKLSSLEFIAEGINRAFSFLNIDGAGGLIDWENTSGRQDIYAESLNIFSNSPLIGHGIGAFLVMNKSAVFSHNIFLDILIDGGLVYLVIWLILIFYCFYQGIRNNKSFFNTFGFYILLLFFLKLLSGSSYFIENLFWFGLSLILVNNYMGNTNKKDITT